MPLRCVDEQATHAHAPDPAPDPAFNPDKALISLWAVVYGGHLDQRIMSRIRSMIMRNGIGFQTLT